MAAMERTDVPSRDEIEDVMRRVCDWQLAHLVDETSLTDGGRQRVTQTGWIRAAFYTGVMATYATTGDATYMQAAHAWGEGNRWQAGPRRRHADDQCVAQTYAELYEIVHDSRMLAAVRANFDLMIEEPMWGPEVGWAKDKNWSWCDALFMAPPGMVRVARATGERKYLALMNRLWWDAYDLLYDTDDHLYYRDTRYIAGPDGAGLRSENGAKIFWGRGNGWVLAGLARTIPYLPADFPDRGRYVDLYREMSERVLGLQQDDGLWRASLLDPEHYPAPETSGSGFFCFGLAWGINAGLLDRATYLPAVVRSWQGLNWAVQEDGRLGWVQPVGHDPRQVSQADTMEFGAGAFLLAGSEMVAL
jgi:rhamnogalacturonyl hydrolase YesR